jgi:sensor domain CHASE-containing protein
MQQATSLRTRIVWYLLLLVLVYASGSYVIQKLSFMRSFSDLEVVSARSDVDRVMQAIEREKEHLAARCTDLASWDEMYRYVLLRDPHFARSSLSDEALGRNRLDLVYVCDMRGKVVFGRCVDGHGEPLVLRDFKSNDLGANHPLITSKVTYNDTGIWITERGAMLVSAQPILDSHGKGPVRGTVILGRMLTNIAEERDERLDELRKQTGVDFEVWLADGKVLDSQGIALSDVLAADADRKPMVRESRDNPEDQLYAYGALEDICGKPALVVVARIERHITAQGATTVRYALVSTMLAGVLMVAVLLYLLQTIVLGPIAKLTAHAVEIGHSEDTTKRLDLQREDELGILSREFDGMMDKLAESRAAVVKAARHAGMSEIATGVLHNVGNVLNSVNVSATLVAERARTSGVADLRMAMEAVREAAGGLKQFIEQDPRGEHLYPLLVALTEQITASRPPSSRRSSA